MDINDTKNLVILECKRVIEIIETAPDLRFDASKAELKRKMAEVRRDTIRLENQMYKFRL